MPTILIVEDNDMNMDMLTRRLQRQGYDILCAEDGQKGLKMAAFHQPSLILMDMSLPILDGWEAARQLKKTENTQHIPIIALTAHALESDRQRCLDAGCDDYESKPVRFPNLVAKIEQFLGVSAGRPLDH